MPTIIGEQRPRAVAPVGPFFYQGSLAANTATTVLVSGSNTYPYVIPMLRAGVVLAMSSYRNTGTSAGIVTAQLALLPAGSQPTDAPQPLSGINLSLPAAGGPVYQSFVASPAGFAAGDALALLVTAATAGTAMFSVNLVVGVG